MQVGSDPFANSLNYLTKENEGRTRIDKGQSILQKFFLYFYSACITEHYYLKREPGRQYHAGGLQRGVAFRGGGGQSGTVHIPADTDGLRRRARHLLQPILGKAAG